MQGRSHGGKGGNCPPEIFSVTTSLQTKILMLYRKSTNNASRDGLRPLGGTRVSMGARKGGGGDGAMAPPLWLCNKVLKLTFYNFSN